MNSESEDGESEENHGKKKLSTESEEKSKDDSRRREGKEDKRVGGRGPVTSHDM